MPTAIVTVQDKWLPEGKKRWVIKGKDGTMYGVSGDMEGRINKGGTYELAYKVDHWNGKDYLVVEGIMVAPVPQTNVGYAEPVNRGSGGSAEPVTDERGTDIAVLAIIKEWVGRIPVGDEGALVHALRAVRRAWLKSKQPDPRGESGRQPEDEIPYDGR